MGLSHPLDRREFLKAAAAAAAACTVDGCGGSPTCSQTFLTSRELQTLAALCEQIIPADEDPGAVEAGVVSFIDRQLATHYTDYQALYRLGLAGVEQTAGERFGARLTDLEFEQQREVLQLLEASQAPGEIWQQTDAAMFFRLVVAHAMYGFYGDPRHGGNRDGVSWQMLGLPYPPVRGREQYSFIGSRDGSAGGEEA